MKNKQMAVIGLGRFGGSLVNEFHRMGYEVLGIDISQARVNSARDMATHVIAADAMDEEVLKSLGIRNFDVVIVSIGDNIQANILTTILLKELGVKKVVAKAQNHLHGTVLEKIGADIVVYPERDMAVKLAHSLITNNIIDFINLSHEYSIMELRTPSRFVGKTLAESNLRKKYNANLIAIKRENDIIITPEPSERLLDTDVLVVLGNNECLEHLSDLD